MSLDYVELAYDFYERHTAHVTDLLKLDVNPRAFKPSSEDLHHPELWKPGHWRWFFENYDMK